MLPIELSLLKIKDLASTILNFYLYKLETNKITKLGLTGLFP